MNTIQVFNHEQFGSIRTMEMSDGQIGFVGKDVASALGYSRPADAIRQHVDDEDKGVVKMQTPGGVQSIVLVNESGLYSLIFSSKLEAARRFKRWVTGEVLPQIRRTGGYIPVKESDSEEDLLARTMEIMGRTLDEKNRLIESLRPKAEYYDETLRSVSTFPVRVIAHTLQMTAQELNRFLCEHGVQYGQSGSYVPYAPYARQGFTRSRTFNRHLKDGTVETQHRTSWTEAGVCFIVNLVKEERRKALPKVQVVQLTFQF